MNSDMPIILYYSSAAADVTTFNDYYKETNNTMGLKGISTGPTWKEWRQPLEKDMFVEWASYLPDIAKTASEISKVAGYEVTEQKNIEFVDFISRSSFDMFTTVMYGKSPQTTNSAAKYKQTILHIGVTFTEQF
jgi:hypothetical protein